MKTKIEHGKKIFVFDDYEELKWYLHKKLCEGDTGAESIINLLEKRTVDQINKFFETSDKPYRIKKTEEL